jgi:ketosteroid isomerase-like protein
VSDQPVGERVRNAIAAYCHALDDGRTDDVVALFCDDAKVDLPGQGVFEGKAAIAEAYAGFAPRLPQRHLVLNTVVSDPVEDGRVPALSDLVFLLKAGDPASWRVQLVGRYEDMFRRDPDGAWRIHRRRARFD